ncbi:MAG: hypothetical protein KIT33_06610 [Candidatus Kapabacteria bacterium]|nr:hypothetical protein [Candidatus Kapabacteria bacterium]
MDKASINPKKDISNLRYSLISKTLKAKINVTDVKKKPKICEDNKKEILGTGAPDDKSGGKTETARILYIKIRKIDNIIW